MHERQMKLLKGLMIFTDIAFIFYWTITFFHLIPAELLFNDYKNPILTAWNWSFLPLDLAVSFSGFTSIILHKKGIPAWKYLAFVSLVLTFCSGLQAISFWVIRLELNPSWWIPNLFLLIYPIFFIYRLIKSTIPSHPD